VVIIRFGDGRVVKLEPGDRMIVGRSPESPLSRICGDNISYLHAEISVENGRAFIIDTNSTNGTFVDGERLEPGRPKQLAASGVQLVRLAADPPLQLALEVRQVA
jgi:pSer/pThr/pTyr-binding forkhead associated (FHA) protein